jgi:hypothetical protein
MEHRTLEQITPVARVVAFNPAPTTRDERRERLRRLASLLHAHEGPVWLFSGLEYRRHSECLALQQDCSPFAVAFADPYFRTLGLKSDRVGDCMEFFGLTQGQTHYLFCECHYGISATPQLIGTRVRAFADRVTIREFAGRVVNAIRQRMA